MATMVQTGRVTLEDFHRMIASGEIGEDDRVELIQGELVPMSSIGPLHCSSNNRLHEYFVLQSQGRWFVANQTALILDADTEVYPDLMLLRRIESDYEDRNPTPSDAHLVIEVSDSSLRFDRLRKVPLYAAAGVAEVWIINLVDNCVEVHREPLAGAFRQKLRFSPGESLAPLAFPDAKLEAAAILRRAA